MDFKEFQDGESFRGLSGFFELKAKSFIGFGKRVGVLFSFCEVCTEEGDDNVSCVEDLIDSMKDIQH